MIDVRGIWSAHDHPWSGWTKHALLASLGPHESVEQAPWSGEDASWIARGRVAVIIDADGPQSVRLAVALGQQGLRPVLSINASSAGPEVIDMTPVIQALKDAARHPSAFPAGPEVLPAFILDSRRFAPRAQLSPGRFDNRWTIFPSDLPPAERLKQAHVEAVLIAQAGDDLAIDVRAITRAYQRAGLEVRLADVSKKAVGPLPIYPKSWLGVRFEQLTRRLTYARQYDGSYGHTVPIPPRPSHG